MQQKLLGVAVIAIIFVAWFIAARIISKPLVLPDFVETMQQFFKGWVDSRTMSNLGITLKRVLTGSAYAVLVGTVIGLLMGYSTKVMMAVSPIVNSIRQIPIMAWVPLSIIWFGLGEGPTVFLIFMSAVFPLIINTVSGVTGIDPNYINAARSMGAGTVAIYRDVIIPGTLPSFLTGLRLAVGSGWMSVICAEFIATSKGFGFLMIEAQERMQTSKLYALMIMSAIVGFVIDQLIRLLEKRLTSWRFKNGKAVG
ncbi:MAG: ABC transporter permease [Lachnospiraceae bacterium]|nr:ABC transporter permease [Candidatus Equihabitans merdae]